MQPKICRYTCKIRFFLQTTFAMQILHQIVIAILTLAALWGAYSAYNAAPDVAYAAMLLVSMVGVHMTGKATGCCK